MMGLSSQVQLAWRSWCIRLPSDSQRFLRARRHGRRLVNLPAPTQVEVRGVGSLRFPGGCRKSPGGLGLPGDAWLRLSRCGRWRTPPGLSPLAVRFGEPRSQVEHLLGQSLDGALQGSDLGWLHTPDAKTDAVAGQKSDQQRHQDHQQDETPPHSTTLLPSDSARLQATQRRGTNGPPRWQDRITTSTSGSTSRAVEARGPPPPWIPADPDRC